MMKTASKESFLELQKYIKFYANKYFLAVLFLVCTTILLAVPVLRESPFMIGKDSFYHLSIAKSILAGDFFSGDFSIGLGLPYVIAGISYITNLSVETTSKLLFFALSFIFLFLCYKILALLEIKEGMISLFVLVLSPPFIYLFSVVNRYAIPLILSLLILYFVLKKKYIFSGIPLLIIPFFSYYAGIFVFLCFLLIWLYYKEKNFILFAFSLIIFVWWYKFGKFNFDVISDLGGDVGLTIFGVFTLFFGFTSFWKKKKFIKLYLIFVIMLLLAFKFSWIIFFLNLPFSLLVGLSLVHLVESKWNSNLIKELSALLLICGLLFSGVSFVKSLSDSEPHQEVFRGLSMLPKGSVVLSHYSYGQWIKYAGMQNVVDGFSEEEKIEEIDALFYTKDLELATNILDKYDVDYILIDENMKHELVWDGEEDGLLFLLKYVDNLALIYDNDVEIWQYIRE